MCFADVLLVRCRGSPFHCFFTRPALTLVAACERAFGRHRAAMDLPRLSIASVRGLIFGFRKFSSSVFCILVFICCASRATQSSPHHAIGSDGRLEGRATLRGHQAIADAVDSAFQYGGARPYLLDSALVGDALFRGHEELFASNFGHQEYLAFRNESGTITFSIALNAYTS